jgi:beta-galactosidase
MKTYEWGSWADIIEPRQGAETLATYTDQFYKGSAAATRHHMGKGTVIYIGVDSLTGDLEADLLRSVYSAAGVNPAHLPINLFVDWRDGFWVASNFTDSTQIVPAPPNTNMISGARSIPPGGTAIWQ